MWNFKISTKSLEIAVNCHFFFDVDNETINWLEKHMCNFLAVKKKRKLDEVFSKLKVNKI